MAFYDVVYQPVLCFLYASSMGTLLPALTPVLFSSVWRPVPGRPLLFAGMIWRG